MVGDILQPTHLLFVLVVALLVLGPKRLPEVGRTLGNGIRDFRSAINGENHDSRDEIESQPWHSPPEQKHEFAHTSEPTPETHEFAHETQPAPAAVPDAHTVPAAADPTPAVPSAAASADRRPVSRRRPAMALPRLQARVRLRIIRGRGELRRPAQLTAAPLGPRPVAAPRGRGMSIPLSTVAP